MATEQKDIKNDQDERHVKAETLEAQDPPEDEYMGTRREHLWISGQLAKEDGECRFSAFEPCYVACIRDLELQIAGKVKSIDFSTGEPSPAKEMAPLLIQYSQLIDALSSIENSDRVFEEDYRKTDDARSQFYGTRRRVANKQDSDKVHDSLRNNIALILIAFLYKWDIADKLKKRFGNLTTTLDRILVGLAGGAALLVPMIIMTFKTSRTARLIVVSVATMLFAVFMAFTSSSKESVIGSVAAYAAIMVVYIGSSDTT